MWQSARAPGPQPKATSRRWKLAKLRYPVSTRYLVLRILRTSVGAPVLGAGQKCVRACARRRKCEWMPQEPSELHGRGCDAMATVRPRPARRICNPRGGSFRLRAMAATEVQGSGVPRPRGVGVPQRVSRISSVLAETSQNKNGKCILAVVGMPTG